MGVRSNDSGQNHRKPARGVNRELSLLGAQLLLQSVTQAFESYRLSRREVDGLPRVRIEIVELETKITMK